MLGTLCLQNAQKTLNDEKWFYSAASEASTFNAVDYLNKVIKPIITFSSMN